MDLQTRDIGQDDYDDLLILDEFETISSFILLCYFLSWYFYQIRCEFVSNRQFVFEFRLILHQGLFRRKRFQKTWLMTLPWCPSLRLIFVSIIGKTFQNCVKIQVPIPIFYAIIHRWKRTRNRRSRKWCVWFACAILKRAMKSKLLHVWQNHYEDISTMTKVGFAISFLSKSSFRYSYHSH